MNTLHCWYFYWLSTLPETPTHAEQVRCTYLQCKTHQGLVTLPGMSRTYLSETLFIDLDESCFEEVLAQGSRHQPEGCCQ